MALIKIEKDPCHHCGSLKKTYLIKLAPIVVKNEGFKKLLESYSWMPIYRPMIKKICSNCGKYIKFEFQSKELVDELNNEQEEQGIKELK